MTTLKVFTLFFSKDRFLDLIVWPLLITMGCCDKILCSMAHQGLGLTYVGVKDDIIHHMNHIRPDTSHQSPGSLIGSKWSRKYLSVWIIKEDKWEMDPYPGTLAPSSLKQNALILSLINKRNWLLVYLDIGKIRSSHLVTKCNRTALYSNWYFACIPTWSKKSMNSVYEAFS